MNGEEINYTRSSKLKQGIVYFQDSKSSVIKTIDVDIAMSEDELTNGLKQCNSFEENKGILFILEFESVESFWMKDTSIPLDIIFVNKLKEIVKIYKDTTPYDTAHISSVKPVKYAVEVNAGFTDKFNIKEGDYFDWKKN